MYWLAAAYTYDCFMQQIIAMLQHQSAVVHCNILYAAISGAKSGMADMAAAIPI